MGSVGLAFLSGCSFAVKMCFHNAQWGFVPRKFSQRDEAGEMGNAVGGNVVELSTMKLEQITD